MAVDRFRELRDVIAGEILVPSAPGYEAARKPAMARFAGCRPQAIVLCESASDVVETLAFARREKLHIAPRAGGHCFAGRSSTDGIVIDVTPLRSVSVSDGLATVGAGARLTDVYDALAEHGLTIPAGCGPSVGIAGLTLGGGLGILGRKHGLTCDHLIAARVVLADGRVVDCDERREPELLWALRGAGGGQFGVVTSFVFRTVPAPHGTSFDLNWSYAQAAPVISAWQSWAPAAPEELSASLRVATRDEPDQPPAVTLFGALLGGGEAETLALLDQLVAASGEDPVSGALRLESFREMKRSLAGLGPGEPELARTTRFSKSELFGRPLPPEAVTALLEAFATERAPGHAREVGFTPLGGAYNRERHDATAFVHRDQQFLVEHALSVDPDVASVEHVAGQWLSRSWASLHPWGSGGVYPNFPDPDLADPGHAYHGANHERLLRVKAAYDPDNAFNFHQSLAGVGS
jgi:FAD/FMN-containing dehydrogenase